MRLQNMNTAANKNLKNTSYLEPFFSPSGVAVIGASPKSENLGGRVIQSLQAHQFPGAVYSVHPSGDSVCGFPAVQAISDLPDTIDLAIAVVSSKATLQLIQPLANKGIHHLIVVGGGFSESGREGEGLQNTLMRSAQSLGVHVLGPNCLGTFSSRDNFNSFFLSPNDLHLPKPGGIGIISQSGAFLSMMLNTLAERGVGVHRATNFGNRVDIGECEVLESFANDPEIRVIGMYLESFQDGQRLIRLVRSMNRQKPIVIYKGGKQEAGGRAARAHSAALSGSYEVFQSICRQLGIQEVMGLNDLINVLQVCSLTPPLKGDRLLIMSNGGGMGVLLTDLCEPFWNIKEPGEDIVENLSQKLPAFYSIKNPIDLTGSGTNFECVQSLETLAVSGLYDALLLVLLPGTSGVTPDLAEDLKRHLPKNFPVVVGAYGPSFFLRFQSSLTQVGIPVFPNGEEAARAINALSPRAKPETEFPGLAREINNDYDATPLDTLITSSLDPLGELELKKLLGKCGIPVPSSFLIEKEQDLDKAVGTLGLPLVLKTNAKSVLHKTEIHGVRLNLTSRENIAEEWRGMNALWPGQIWGEEQMPEGLDLMVGFHRDSDFGCVLVFGTGGSFVEIYQDIERVSLPAENAELISAILKTNAGKIIRGVRGHSGLDLESLFKAIQFFAHWMEKTPDIQSLDFNPVRLYTSGLVILDAKLGFKSHKF